MSFANASNYGKFQVIKKKPWDQLVQEKVGNAFASAIEKKVDIPGKISGFNYYESIYSPMVTANFIMLSTGGDTNTDRTELASTLKDGLPVEGFEEVLIKLSNESGTLDWTKKKRRFVIIGSPFNIDENQRQTAFFTMVSKNAIKAANTVVDRVYGEKGGAKISEIAKSILKNTKITAAKHLGSTDKEYSLKGTFQNKNFHKTENTMKFTGNQEPPLDSILKLCPRSIPESGGDPGYFFFENSEGFNFKSIHMMIEDGYEKFNNSNYAKEHTYYYESGSVHEINLKEDKNNYRVLLPPTVRRDQDILNALKKGEYNVRICVLNSETLEYEEKIVTFHNNEGTVTLGDGIVVNPGNDQDNDNISHCLTYSYVIKPGSEIAAGDDFLIKTVNEYEPKARFRYALLHAQLVDIQVPCNLELTVGEVIKLNIETVTQETEDKVLEQYNEHRSGYYLILHLCHYFDEKNSFTALTLARDEYGRPRQFQQK
tara:strand:+ start:3474 stop:4928 length:1455 start_codon:yes stop_codon:yes gene_type:complete